MNNRFGCLFLILFPTLAGVFWLLTRLIFPAMGGVTIFGVTAFTQIEPDWWKGLLFFIAPSILLNSLYNPVPSNAQLNPVGWFEPVNIGEPTYSETGKLIGYKWVTWDGKSVISPQQGTVLRASPSGWVTADRKPTMKNNNGIYVAYDPRSSVLSGYRQTGNVLVEVRCKGEVVHHEYGARVEKMTIVRVVDFNNHPKMMKGY